MAHETTENLKEGVGTPPTEQSGTAQQAETDAKQELAGALTRVETLPTDSKDTDWGEPLTVTEEANNIKEGLSTRLEQLPNASSRVQELVRKKIEQINSGLDTFTVSRDRALLDSGLDSPKRLADDYADMLDGDPGKNEIRKNRYEGYTDQDLKDLIFILSGEMYEEQPDDEA